MVAVGGVIELNTTGKILLVQRADNLDWHPGEWEISYGRIDQYEDAETGLRRELREEVGLHQLDVIKVLRTWHIYRGSEQTAHNELIGLTFLCNTTQEKITISDEHQSFAWMTPEEALKLIKVDGIKKDIELFQEVLTERAAASEHKRNKVGKDHIGVGVGAAIFNDKDEVLLGKRGEAARNEVGMWEIPGGAVDLGETLAEALVREVKEELGIVIEVGELFQVCDHLLPKEDQHWVSPTYLCHIKSGTPIIMEPHKCAEIGWFSLEEAEKLPLSVITKGDIEVLKTLSPQERAKKSGLKPQP
jgi:mutator protein MutT